VTQIWHKAALLQGGFFPFIKCFLHCKEPSQSFLSEKQITDGTNNKIVLDILVDICYFLLARSLNINITNHATEHRLQQNETDNPSISTP